MKIEERQKLLVIVAIIAVAALACDRLILTPMIGAWKTRSERIDELTQDITKGTALLNREQGIRARWSNMASNALPANASLAESKVLKSVDQWTRESGISFTGIKPSWKQNDDDYQTLECRADGFGDLQSIAKFIFDLERDPLALRVEDLDLAARDNEGQQLTLAVRFTGLVLTGKPEAAK